MGKKVLFLQLETRFEDTKHGIRHIGLAAVVAVGVFCIGGAGRNIPSDEAMTRNFRANEEAFAEMVALLQDFPSWEAENPGGCRWRDGYWPEATECREFLGKERASRLDSPLHVTGCENVHFRYCRPDSCAATSRPGEYSFTYHARCGNAKYKRLVLHNLQILFNCKDMKYCYY